MRVTNYPYGEAPPPGDSSPKPPREVTGWEVASGIVIGSITAAELWTRVDVSTGMLVAVVAPLVSVGAMIAFRPRALPSPA